MAARPFVEDTVVGVSLAVASALSMSVAVPVKVRLAVPDPAIPALPPPAVAVSVPCATLTTTDSGSPALGLADAEAPPTANELFSLPPYGPPALTLGAVVSAIVIAAEPVAC